MIRSQPSSGEVKRSGPVPARARILCFGSILALSSCAGGDLPPGFEEEGVSWELAEHRRSTLEDVEYEFAFWVPEARGEPIQGSVRVRFSWEDEERRPIVFDFLHPGDRVRAVALNGAPAEFLAVNDHLALPVPSEVPLGPTEVVLEFTAGDEALNRSEDFLYALFVPDRARYSVPVFDQPNLKARFSVFLDLPVGWTAMANGRQIREEVEGARRRFRFAASDPLPTYLFSFVAGEFEKVTRRRGDRVMEFLHRETDREKVDRNLEELFDLHVAALDWLEEYTGIPYPFQKIGFVAIPSFQYGGMEHPGAVFYRDASLFLDESATQAQYLGRASLIAHETAHMWFGDLVTMHWFDDVWTKEVFANFMAAKIVHPSFPEVNHDLRFVLAHHPAAYEVDRTEGANPIRQPLGNLREAGSLYGAIIYQKAPVVMRQLELLVGEEPFRDGIREYLRTFSYGNATWPDLVDILDRASPQDLAAWSQVWVEEAGRPILWVDGENGPDGEMVTLTLHQADPREEGRVWPQSVSVALGYGRRALRLPLRFPDGALTVADVSHRPAPDFILPDGWGEGYGLFRLDPGSREYLLQYLPSLEDPVVRGAAWLTLWDGVLEGEVAPRAFLDLALRSLEVEEEEQILQRTLSTLETVYWTLILDEDRLARAAEVEAELWRGMERAENASRKSAFFRAYRSMAVTPPALTALEGIWRGDRTIDGLPLSESDRTALASALALREVEGWERILDAELVNIDNPDRRAQFEFVRPSLDADSNVREAFFESLREPTNREREPWVLTAVENLHHPLRRAHARVFILPSLELLEELQRTGDIFFPARWMTATLGRHNSPEAAEAVRGFLSSRAGFSLQLRLKILQAADPLFRAEEILTRSGS